MLWRPGRCRRRFILFRSNDKSIGRDTTLAALKKKCLCRPPLIIIVVDDERAHAAVVSVKENWSMINRYLVYLYKTTTGLAHNIIDSTYISLHLNIKLERYSEV